MKAILAFYSKELEFRKAASLTASVKLPVITSHAEADITIVTGYNNKFMLTSSTENINQLM